MSGGGRCQRGNEMSSPPGWSLPGRLPTWQAETALFSSLNSTILARVIQAKVGTAVHYDALHHEPAADPMSRTMSLARNSGRLPGRLPTMASSDAFFSSLNSTPGLAVSYRPK